MTPEEQARLDELDRIATIEARWKSIKDPILMYHRLGISAGNMALEKKRIIDENHTARLDVIEAEDVVYRTELQAEEDARPEKELRESRDKLLSASDFSQLADAPFTSAEKVDWRDYRTYLRDLPELKRLGQLQIGPVEFSEWKVWKDSL